MLQPHAATGATLTPPLNNSDARELQVLKRKPLLIDLANAFAGEKQCEYEPTFDLDFDNRYQTRSPAPGTGLYRIYELLKMRDATIKANVGEIEGALGLEKWELHALVCVADLTSHVLSTRLRRLADGKRPRWLTKR